MADLSGAGGIHEFVPFKGASAEHESAFAARGSRYPVGSVHFIEGYLCGSSFQTPTRGETKGEETPKASKGTFKKGKDADSGKGLGYMPQPGLQQGADHRV